MVNVNVSSEVIKVNTGSLNAAVYDVMAAGKVTRFCAAQGFTLISPCKHASAAGMYHSPPRENLRPTNFFEVRMFCCGASGESRLATHCGAHTDSMLPPAFSLLSFSEAATVTTLQQSHSAEKKTTASPSASFAVRAAGVVLNHPDARFRLATRFKTIHQTLYWDFGKEAEYFDGNS